LGGGNKDSNSHNPRRAIIPCINKSVIQSKAGLQSIVEAEVGENFLEGKPRELECRLSSTRGLE
jgi:hypothetical protein